MNTKKNQKKLTITCTRAAWTIIFDDHPNKHALICAYQHLIDTGAIWVLDGEVARRHRNIAKTLIRSGKCYRKKVLTQIAPPPRAD